MAYYASNFMFDDIPSERFGLIIVSDDSGESSTNASNNVNLITQEIFRRPKPYFYGVQQTPVLEFPIKFMTTEYEITASDSSIIQQWLFGQMNYKELRILQPDMQDIYYMCFLTDPQIIRIGNIVRGYSCTVKCDSPFAYGEEINDVIIENNADYIDNTYEIENKSENNYYTFPTLGLTTTDVFYPKKIEITGSNFTSIENTHVNFVNKSNSDISYPCVVEKILEDKTKLIVTVPQIPVATDALVKYTVQVDNGFASTIKDTIDFDYNKNLEPYIYSITPNIGFERGTTSVVIRGINLYAGSTRETRISFYNTSTEAISLYTDGTGNPNHITIMYGTITDTYQTLTFNVPSELQLSTDIVYKIIVTDNINNRSSSNDISFTYPKKNSAPWIDDIQITNSPTAGVTGSFTGGTAITLIGKNFTKTGKVMVGTQVNSYTFTSSNEIKFTTPVTPDKETEVSCNITNSSKNPAVVTFSTVHGLSTGDTITFISSTTLPPEIILNTVYTVTRVSSTEINISLNGIPICTSTAGTGLVALIKSAPCTGINISTDNPAIYTGTSNLFITDRYISPIGSGTTKIGNLSPQKTYKIDAITGSTFKLKDIDNKDSYITTTTSGSTDSGGVTISKPFRNCSIQSTTPGSDTALLVTLANHGYITGNPVIFIKKDTALPAKITEGKIYRIIRVSENTFNITDVNGPASPITGNLSSTINGIGIIGFNNSNKSFTTIENTTQLILPENIAVGTPIVFSSDIGSVVTANTIYYVKSCTLKNANLQTYKVEISNRINGSVKAFGTIKSVTTSYNTLPGFFNMTVTTKTNLTNIPNVNPVIGQRVVFLSSSSDITGITLGKSYFVNGKSDALITISEESSLTTLEISIPLNTTLLYYINTDVETLAFTNSSLTETVIPINNTSSLVPHSPIRLQVDNVTYKKAGDSSYSSLILSSVFFIKSITENISFTLETTSGGSQTVYTSKTDTPSIPKLYTSESSSSSVNHSKIIPVKILEINSALNDDDPIIFNTIPNGITGINVSTIYYVKNKDSTGFNIASTSGGTNIITAGNNIPTQGKYQKLNTSSNQDVYFQLTDGTGSNHLSFTYGTVKPIITILSVFIGNPSGGTHLDIYGTNFTKKIREVSFGDAVINKDFEYFNGYVRCYTPSHIPEGDVIVKIKNYSGYSNDSNGIKFTYNNNLPAITGVDINISPLKGGMIIKINGNYFSPHILNTTPIIKIGGTNVALDYTSILTKDDVSSIICYTPPLTAGAKDIVLTYCNDVVSTLTGGITYKEHSPSYTDFIPKIYPAQTQVTAFKIINESDSDRLVQFGDGKETGLSIKETLIINSDIQTIINDKDENRLNISNLKFLRLVPGLNKLKISGYIKKLVLSYKPFKRGG